MSNINNYNKERQFLSVVKDAYKNITVKNPLSEIEEKLNAEFSKLNIKKLRHVWNSPDFSGIIDNKYFLQGTYLITDNSELNNEGIMLLEDDFYFFKSSATNHTGDPRILSTKIIYAKNLNEKTLSIHADISKFLSSELIGVSSEDKKVMLSMNNHPLLKQYFENKYNSLINNTLQNSPANPTLQ
jgi:hypothetical protein